MQNSITKADHFYIKAYIDGDEYALSVLLNKYKDKLFSYILYMVKNKEVSKDIFQEVFMKVINNLKKGKYQDKGKFYPWIKMIAHNYIIDYFRKNKKLIHNTEEFDLINNLVAEEDSEEFDSEQMKTIKEKIKLLPKSQKEVLMMRLNYDMSFKEIAKTTNVSINTSLGRMRYALINLRRDLKIFER